jgi:hypothetical protein
MADANYRMSLKGRTMQLFFRLSTKYALAAAAIFVLQALPFPVGGLLMILGGILWIGVLVHGFMIHITIMSMSGAIPRLILLLPGAFYGAGLAMGLASDIPASRWQSHQQWLRIDKRVPPGTREVAFADTSFSLELRGQDRAFQPEKLGFELFDLAKGIFQPYDKSCPSQEWTAQGRCTATPMERPSAYVLIGGKGDGCPIMEEGVRHFSWGTIIPGCEPITLRVGDYDGMTLGWLSGAIVKKRSYFLFPTAGCGLVDHPPSWVCTWLVSPMWRDSYVGYYLSINGSSRSNASILMSALAQLRGQTTTP